MLLLSRIEVILIDMDQAAAEKGKEYSTKILDKQLSKKKLLKKKEKLLSLITPTTDYY